MDILKQLWLAQKEMIGKRRLTKFVLVWDPDLRYCTTRPNKSNKTSVMTTWLHFGQLKSPKDWGFTCIQPELELLGVNHRSGCTMAQRKSRQKLEKGCSPGNKNNNDNGNAGDKNENNHKNSRKKKKKKKKKKKQKKNKNNKTTLTTKNSPFPSFGHQPNSAIVPASGCSWVGPQAHPDCGSAHHRHHFGGSTPKHLGDSRRKLGSQAPDTSHD